MLLKKQTVWLLTMLSLVFVLSVYYFVGGPNDQLAFDENKQEQQDMDATSGDNDATKEDDTDVDADTTGDNEVISHISSAEDLAGLRFKLNDIRSKQKDDLSAVTANTSLSIDEINKAKEELNALHDIESKELMLEQQIKSRGIDDALVRVINGEVTVMLKAEESSPKLANEIYHLIREQFPNVRNENVAIQFQATATANND
ncbi:SpoIIIAH-like family protein [Sutcliffiella sp. NC1]|uniref:SpoIIIAH-like family protein n=1 Tax=Sutcliffiella sp. NC1 TaxID=3004096 RepID=UPI0022DCE8EB|nr:SpoIIIAH-like family protein [Sutcliffiella sp. NC1]WBL13689.1 SpoIIIAH-like family protein [Sutcliffiella sp. NC1]